MIEPDRYSTIAFIDTMVVLECKALDVLQWEEIDPVGPILVLIVPQVQKEVDQRKRDPRLAERARGFTRLMKNAMDSPTVRLVDRPVVVDIGFARCTAVDWTGLDLDREEGDHRLVAQILSAEGHENSILLSHDLNPLLVARQRGITARQIPETWLMSPEPGIKDKEIQRLKQRIKQYEVIEPSFEAEIVIAGSPIIPVVLFDPLPPDAKEHVRNWAENEHGELTAKQNRRFTIATGCIALTDTEFHEFVEGELAAYTDTLHTSLQRLFNQHAFSFTVENTGIVGAKRLIIELNCRGGTIHDRVFYPAIRKPLPQPRGHAYRPLFNAAGIRPPILASHHEVMLWQEPEKGQAAEWHCADFRHGKSFTFNGIATVDAENSDEFELVLRVTAQNFHGHYTSSKKVSFFKRQATIANHFNIYNDAVTAEYPLKDLMESLEESESELIEWEGEEE